MKRLLPVVYAIGGIALALALTLLSYAVAGRQLAEPAEPLRAPRPLAPRPAATDPSPTPRVSPSVEATPDDDLSPEFEREDRSGSDGDNSGSGSDNSGSGSDNSGSGSDSSGSGGNSGPGGGDD